MFERAISKTGWTRVAFGDVVRKVNDKVDPWESGLERYVAGEHMDSDDLRIRRWGLIGDDYLGPAFHMRFKPGHVLYGSRRTYLRKVALADFDGITANTTFVLESKDPGRLMPDLLPFLMKTEAFHSYSIKNSKGSVNPYINFSDLEAFEFLLPPLQEQERIVSAATAALSAIDAYADALSAAEQLRKSLFVRLFRRGTIGEPVVAGSLGELPRSWQVCALGERFEVQLGKRISELELTGPFDIPYMRNANVQWNRLDLEDVATVRVTATEREKYALREGDILACEGRHVGKAAMWHEEVPGAIYQMALHRLRPLSEADHPRFMLHCLQYYSWTGVFAADTAETTIPHLSAERFRAMLFPFPPKEEQEAIAAAIDRFDATLGDLKARAKCAQSVLSQLLRDESF